jgi:hypothetical protein
MFLEFRYKEFSGCLRITSNYAKSLSGKGGFCSAGVESGFGYFVKAIDNETVKGMGE